MIKYDSHPRPTKRCINVCGDNEDPVPIVSDLGRSHYNHPEKLTDSLVT